MKKTLILTALLVLPSLGAAAEEELSVLDDMSAIPSIEMTDGAEKCANFSGKWKGNCVTNDGKTFEEELRIDQKGCGFLAISGKKHHQHAFLMVGGMSHSSVAMPGCSQGGSCGAGMTFNHGTESHWNKDLTALNIQCAGHGKKLALNERPHGFFSHREMKLVDGKLFIESKSVGSHGGQLGPAVKLCTLSAVN